MAKRPKIGDIIEIKTSKGLGYAQCSHKHAQYGHLLRVFKPLFSERPSNFAHLAVSEPGFLQFFPLGAAVHRGIVTIAGHEPVPASGQTFPVFRSGMINPRTGKVDCWWLWDGENEWRAGELAPKQYDLPILSVCNDTLLIERLESGWTAATDPYKGLPRNI